jgi:hypothetical protein
VTDLKNAKLYFDRKEIADVTNVSYESDSDAEPTESLGLTGTTTAAFNIETSPSLDELTRIDEMLRWFGFSLFGCLLPSEYARDPLAAHLHPNAVPLDQAGPAARGRAVLGVTTWRMLGELQAPPHRRTCMAVWWARALKACPKEAMAAWAEVRREYGDFDAEALTTN